MSESENPTPAELPPQTDEDIARTINKRSEADEASLESFPASDPPGPSGQRVGPADLPHPQTDDGADDAV